MELELEPECSKLELEPECTKLELEPKLEGCPRALTGFGKGEARTELERADKTKERMAVLLNMVFDWLARKR